MTRSILLALIIIAVWMPAIVIAQTPGPDNILKWKSDSTSEFEVGTQIRAWTIQDEGIENILENYALFQEELVEEWGVETNGTGTATYTFAEPSGIYDIRITYFDENDGQARVALLIAGEEKTTFTLDEDTDCWRWRIFENVRVNSSDEIQLVGKAHKNERAKLDYIEFIPGKPR